MGADAAGAGVLLLQVRVIGVTQHRLANLGPGREGQKAKELSEIDSKGTHKEQDEVQGNGQQQTIRAGGKEVLPRGRSCRCTGRGAAASGSGVRPSVGARQSNWWG